MKQQRGIPRSRYSQPDTNPQAERACGLITGIAEHNFVLESGLRLPHADRVRRDAYLSLRLVEIEGTFSSDIFHGFPAQYSSLTNFHHGTVTC